MSKIQFVLIYTDPKSGLSKMQGFTRFERLVDFISDCSIETYEVFNKIA